MDDLFADFLAETREMLEALGGELVAWEDDPGDRARLDAIFRFFHTVKGNCGFFDFPRLESLSHAVEDVLADVRADRRKPDFALVSAVLAIVDRIGDMVDTIEGGGELPDGGDDALIVALKPQAELPVQTLQSLQAADGTEPRDASQGRRSIRLPVELLDRVMSSVSDMVLARNDLARRLRESSAEAVLHEPFERLSSIIADVRDAMTQTRMQPLEGLFSMLPRLARDLSAELGKQVKIEVDGSEVELDREMIEIIRNPLTHIIRNAVDHGIEKPEDRRASGKRETGLLSISARQSGNQILIDIVDDGRGIDDGRLVEKAIANGVIDAAAAAGLSRGERVALIFEPGISTAEAVTAISGRGVGMDVVRANIERVGGALEVMSAPGQGTRLSLRVPLTLTIIPVLTVSSGGQRFAIPRSSVEEIVEIGSRAVEVTRHGGAMLAKIRNRRLPGLELSDLLDLESAVDSDERTLVVLRLTDGKLFTLAVDRLHNHEELVVKPAAPAIIATGLYAGTTLTDDGHPTLLLEVAGLAKAGGLKLDALEHSDRLADTDEAAAPVRETPVLLFIGLDGKRKAIPMAVVDRLEEVGIAALEIQDDLTLVVIGDRVLPLAGTAGGLLPDHALRLFLLTDGQREIGYGIREALGVRHVDAALVAANAASETEGVLLVDAEATTLISPYKLFARHASAPARDRRPACHLASDDPWLQNFVRPIVEAAGYRIAGAGEADMDLAILSMPDALHPAGARQVIRLRATPGEPPDEPGSIYRYDHAGLLSALRVSTGGSGQ
ncbi:chemotaxis protein CheA [Novosphingobium album (ex Hu et al. 2023)]|uniref:histidine kinase n=1 Tax=Novosphingobium album (ex Hu et al. 2023) TaxID=2930093 RepID=A0ABT0B3Q5_9SPHN|nr:chemotaxis protein CheW [Novosphingobium album (ex Hu et al. 2023)]MCJ2179674.1 chemotaxis protein CheW [Novosphingobium album (ex Hu et al. 2023)]